MNFPRLQLHLGNWLYSMMVVVYRAIVELLVDIKIKYGQICRAF
jgi:hypothetical protein